MKQVVVIDIDEVLQPFFHPFHIHHDEQYGTTITKSDPQDRYYLEQFTGDPSEVVERKLEAYVKTEDFTKIKPLRGAVEAVLWLRQHDFEPVVITARQPFFVKATHNFLDAHFPQAFKGVHFISHHVGSSLTPAASKLDICKELGAAYVIDDNVGTATLCAEAGIKAILFGDYSWNQSGDLPEGVTRCKDWAAVLEYFDA
jgi:hypothetical protein